MYFLFILGKFFSLIFPRFFCYKVAKLIAILKFIFHKRDRENLIYNLNPIIKDRKKREKVARNITINFSYYLVDFFRYSKLNKNFINKYVKFSGFNYLEEFLLQKKSFIALTAHLGNYELAAAITSFLGYPVYAVVLPHKDKRLTIFFKKQRETVGIKVIFTGIGIKKCFSVLKGANILALLEDKDFFGNGKIVEFFGKKVRLPQGAIFFSLKTSTPIIPVFLIRENTYYYHFIFEKPLNGKDENSLMREIVLVLEKYIKKYPDQWYMFEKYWIEK